MIRDMEEKDIPYLIDLGYQLHQEGNFKNLDYDREKCKKLGNTLLTNPDFKCFISFLQLFTNNCRYFFSRTNRDCRFCDN